MLLKFILIIYIICLFFIIILILLSRGKGAEIGATFNSSSIDLFGSKGSNSIINKLIIITAIIALITNISLNFINKNYNKDSYLEIEKKNHKLK